MKGFPWAEAMAFGLGTLRLPPEQFWRMTPRELAALASTSNPPREDDLAELMRRYPDGGDHATHDGP